MLWAELREFLVYGLIGLVGTIGLGVVLGLLLWTLYEATAALAQMLLAGLILLYAGGAGFTFLCRLFEETTWKLTRWECALWILLWPVYWILVAVAYLTSGMQRE